MYYGMKMLVNAECFSYLVIKKRDIKKSLTTLTNKICAPRNISLFNVSLDKENYRKKITKWDIMCIFEIDSVI